MHNKVIIVAGGIGKRMNSEIPKQFLILNNLPVLMHSMLKFYNYDKLIEIIIVLPQQQIDYWKSLCKFHNFKIKHRIVVGGETRFHSSKNAIDTINEKCLVAIHDGVRPLVSLDTINRCFDIARSEGNAIPIINLVDSIRKVEKDTHYPVNRDEIVKCQTPQVFDSDILKEAFKQEYSSEFTDDAIVVEKLRYKINLVEGNKENIKITNKQDLAIAESLIKLM